MSNIKIAAYIDTETTGFYPGQDEIIELSIVLFSFDLDTGEVIEIKDEYTGLRDPSVPIKRKASEVHGIYKGHVKGKELNADRIKILVEQCDIVISHNAKFDKSFMDAIGLRINGEWYCSMDGIPWKTTYGFKSKGLQNLLVDHGIKVDQSHRADADSKAAISLLSQKSKDGEYYLKVMLSNGPMKQVISRQKSNDTTDDEYSRNVRELIDTIKNKREVKQNNTSIGCTAFVIVAIIIIIMFMLSK